MHQILIHGNKVISTMLMPIGLLSEEAPNKDNKYFCVHHTHKKNKISGSKDFLHNQLLSSDPIISFFKRKKSHSSLTLSPEVISKSC